MSVMSSGFFASQATAALQVIALPAVDLNSARSEEKSGDVAGTQNSLDTAMALRSETGIEGGFSNLKFVDGTALRVETVRVVLRAANKVRGEGDMGEVRLTVCQIWQMYWRLERIEIRDKEKLDTVKAGEYVCINESFLLRNIEGMCIESKRPRKRSCINFTNCMNCPERTTIPNSST